MKTVSKSEEYVIASRRIAGTRAEKAAQIDAAIQELLDIKLLECAGDRPNVQFVAAPRRGPWVGMSLAILVLLVLLVLLLGVRPARAQDAGTPAPPPKSDSGKPANPAADEIWSHVTFANEPRPDAYRNVWQAYGSYVFPVGRGLQVDFGTFASNLGHETTYPKDNVNFSRVRGEFRRDWSNQPFFPVHDGGISAHQNTALGGLVWWIGNKTGSW